MINMIKPAAESEYLKDIEKQYVIQNSEGSIYEADNYSELAAVLIGDEFLDAETAETKWHYRVNYAKKTGLYLNAMNDTDKTIIYDERIGKILYSYTEANPDYSIPEDAKLIRVESDETFIISQAILKFILVWERIGDEYKLINDIYNLNEKMEDLLVQFKDKAANIPLHQKLENK